MTWQDRFGNEKAVYTNMKVLFRVPYSITLWQGKNCLIQRILPKFYPSKFTLEINLPLVIDTGYCKYMHNFAPQVMIGTDSFGLLNQLQMIDLSKALAAYLWTKRRRVHCNLARFTFHQCSFMPQLAKVSQPNY